MTSTGQTVTLNDDNEIPVVGLGVGELSDEQTVAAVSAALEAGYRLIDTAAVYGNEAAVGRAIAGSGIARSELFVTTKVANADQGFKSVQQACKGSLERLGLDYVDLYLIHWPQPQLGKYVDTFGGMLTLRQEGLARSLGVCNFNETFLSTLIDLAFVTPAVNQLELHPLLNQADMRRVHAQRGVATEAFSPLGAGTVLNHPALVSIAQAHHRTPAQVVIRWNVQLGNIVIPRSATPDRIRGNIAVFDFELTEDEMTIINGLDDGTRVRPDPLTYTGI